MKIEFNQKEQEIADGTSLEEFIRLTGLNPERVIVELNGELTAGGDWGGTALKEGDRIFAVTFVGGG